VGGGKHRKIDVPAPGAEPESDGGTIESGAADDVSGRAAGAQTGAAGGARSAGGTGAAPDTGAASGKGGEAGADELLAAARAEAAEHYDQYLRARAELDNVRKRHERDRSERAKYAVEPLARDLLAVVDDLERAREHAGVSEGGLADGVRLVLKGLSEVMAAHGIERIATEGLPFDPASHEAVAMAETDRVPAGYVMEEQRAGYRLKDRLLRPAMVVVAKAPTGQGSGE